MAIKACVGSKIRIEAIQGALSALYHLPRKGIHIGGGYHVELGDTPRAGWAIHQVDIVKHPKRDEYSVVVYDGLAEMLENIMGDDLITDEQKALLIGACHDAIELPADWDPIEVVDLPLPEREQ